MLFKRKIAIACICTMIFMLTGCNSSLPLPQVKPTPEATPEVTQEAKDDDDVITANKDLEAIEEETKDDKPTSADGDVIVAGSMDTSSKFSFSVEEAIVGLDDYDTPIVVLVGNFTNNSDEAIEFGYALSAEATQDGFELDEAYLSGIEDFHYVPIKPDESIPVFLGWDLLDDVNDITLTVIDRNHYADEEIYSQTFTIDELIKNTEKFEDLDKENSDKIIDKPL